MPNPTLLLGRERCLPGSRRGGQGELLERTLLVRLGGISRLRISAAGLEALRQANIRNEGAVRSIAGFWAGRIPAGPVSPRI
jgi:hypothetical protein